MDTPNIFSVTYFQRMQGVGVSLERLFGSLRYALPDHVHADIWHGKYHGTNPAHVAANIMSASRAQGDVNHVTGDIHYVCLGTRPARTVLTILDCWRYEELSGIRKFLFYWLWLKLPVERAAVVTVISSDTRDRVLRYTGCQEEKVQVVHCCLPAHITRNPKAFNSECPMLLQIGSKPTKNLEHVARALKGVPCHLRIIGKPTPSQKQILAESGVRYSAVSGISDEQMAREYQACDAVITASVHEGFGLPIIEGQATGRPVIAGNTSAMPEVAGDGARLVDPLSVESIREGIMDVLQKPDYRSTLIERGYANVERFSPQRIASQYVDIYERLLEKDR